MKKILLPLILFLSFFNRAAAQGGIESGLVAKYCFSGNADDALGLRNATAIGATLTTDRFGVANEAYLLDGINDYIQLPDDIWVSGNFSFTGWLYLNGQDSWARFFEWGNGIDKDNVFYCPYQSGQMVFTIHQCSSPARTYAYNPSTVATGAWTHIAITLTGDTVRVYKNNSFVYSFKMTYIPCSVVRTQCYLGKSNFPNPYLEGKIDDIRIYNRAISAIEIDSIYNLVGCGSSMVDPCAGTTANFKDTNTSCYTFDFTDLSVAKDSGIVSWNWDFGDLSTSSLKNPTHTYANYGTYNVRLIVSDSSGCVDTFIKSVSINYSHFANAGKDTFLCLNNGLASTILLGNGGTSYSWSPTTGLVNPTAKNTMATISTATTYYLTVTNAFGCRDQDTVNINLHPIPMLTNTPKNAAVCIGANLQLNVSGAKTYQWTPAAELDSAQKSNPWVNNIQSPKTLVVKGTDANGCVAVDTVKITLNPAVVLSLNPKNIAACASDTVSFNVTGALTYKWSPSEGLDNDSISNPKHFVSTNKTYYVKGKNAQGCEGTDSLSVILYPNPIVEAYAFANKNIVRCQGDEVNLSATGASSYSWSPAEYCANATSSSTNVFPPKSTVFTVTGINDNGCKATDTLSVIYDGKEKAFVPNVFTPNNDQLNDKIGVVDACNIVFLSFDIYNRWGQNVYSGYNLTDKWDGTFNGQPCEMGTYFYLIKARSLEGVPVEFKGDITLVR